MKRMKVAVYFIIILILIRLNVFDDNISVVNAEEENAVNNIENIQNDNEGLVHIETTDDEYCYSIIDDGVKIIKYQGHDREVIIPDSINGCPVIEIEERAFENQEIICVSVPKTVLSAYHSFYNCTNLETIVIEDGMETIPSYMAAGVYSLKNVEIPESVRNIGHYAFLGCSGLTQIKFPANLKWIGSHAFEGCGLKEIVFPEGMETIDESAFYACGEVGRVGFSSTIKVIGKKAFAYCNKIQEIQLPPKLDRMDEEVFTSPYIIKIKIPKETGSIYRSFKGCTNLETIVIEDGMETIPSYMAAGVYSLKNVEIPESITEIGAYAFSNCTNLEKVELPSNLILISANAFEWSGLLEIILPQNLKSISFSAFQNCSELRCVKFSGTVTRIGRYIFKNCTSLNRIFFADAAPKDWENDSFENVTATAYYPINNPTWNDNVKSSYGGDITWKTWDPNCPDYLDGLENTEKINCWISNKGNYNSFKYLCQSSNFPHVIYIKNNDDTFVGKFELYWTNMFFKGSDGWRNLLSSEISVSNAEEILLGLIEEYDGEISQIAEVETGKNLCSLWKSAMETYAWVNGIEDGSIKIINDTLSGEKFTTILKESGYQGIMGEILPLISNQSQKERVEKMLEDLSVSDEIGKGLDKLSTGLKVVDLTKFTFDNIFKYCSMMCANEIELEMLDYLSQNCPYGVVRQAAENLSNRAKVSLYESKSKIIQCTAKEVGVWLGEETFNEMIDKVWFLKAAKQGKDWGVSLANKWFHTEEIADLKDSIRIVAYSGHTLGNWSLENMNAFLTAENTVEKNKVAKKLLYSTKMLIKTRELGECTFRDIEVYLKDQNGYQLSRNVSFNIKNVDKWLFSDGNNSEYVNVIIACPVSVEIYKDKSKIAEIAEEETVEMETDFWRGESFLDLTTSEYVKILLIPKDDNYSLKLEGTDMGFVDYRVMSISDVGVGIYKSKENISIEKRSIIGVPALNNGNIIEVDYEGTQTSIQNISIDQVDEYIAVSSLNSEKETLIMKKGDKEQLQFSVKPENATCQKVIFTSSDAKIVVVNTDGVVEALSVGTTDIIANSVDGNYQIIYHITVQSGNKGDITGDGKLSINDLLMILHHISGKNLLNEEQISNADINEDGKVGINDLLRVLHFISGTSSEL